MAPKTSSWKAVLPLALALAAGSGTAWTQTPAAAPPSGGIEGADVIPDAAANERCDASQRRAIRAARGQALSRVQETLRRLDTPPGPLAAMPDRHDEQARIRARRNLAITALTLNEPGVDLAQVVVTLRQMEARLKRIDGFAACLHSGHPNFRMCRSRDAWVYQSDPPIFLCPNFWTTDESTGLSEKQIRVLVHEVAHLSGIGDPSAESYCMTFDCRTNCGPMGPADCADCWSHLVHCMSGQPPDGAPAARAP